ncbi:4-hydroxy-tetrahydrodipicolinate reductase [Candidatus Endomicrobiellum cubanum]|jgi:4-hydroxy-tetrahydrodipicolinate reductase|uniref:4-hydroxy-tetrahydrodipicolinate reductase n=1 Tax=Candidatus Endomicrobiellum cubanum TaxID=3242325 RepID=UPI00359470E6
MEMKIVVCGAAGRMGKTIINLAIENSDFEVIVALEYEGNKAIGRGDPIISSINDLGKVLKGTDVVIDFTNPESTLNNLEHIKQYNVPVVIGTTGFSVEQRQKIEDFSKSIPILLSPNMSVGVNILFKLVKEVTKKIPDYDIEILELHHNKKKDAPSGTAARLAEIAASAKCENIKDIAVYGRHGSSCTRAKEEIGVFSIRAGDIVGDHTVYFVGQGERIELTHRASSRDTFASGALKAAKWLVKQKSGLYDMADVLNLK